MTIPRTFVPVPDMHVTVFDGWDVAYDGPIANIASTIVPGTYTAEIVGNADGDTYTLVIADDMSVTMSVNVFI